MKKVNYAESNPFGTTEIAELVRDIKYVYQRLNPNGDYLSICIHKDSLSFNNRFWDDDANFPLNYWEFEDEE